MTYRTQCRCCCRACRVDRIFVLVHFDAACFTFGYFGHYRKIVKCFFALGGVAIAFAKVSSDKAAEVEDLAMQFETLTKNAATTKKLMADFRKEARKSPLSTTDYAQAGKLLMNFGISAEGIMPVLKMIGDVSMGNADRFNGLSLAFAQVASLGRLTGEELTQMTERGFNPLYQLSKKTGESMSSLADRMRKGEISVYEVAQAFKFATDKGGDYFGAIEKGANTTSGKIAKLKDAVDQLQIAFGTGMNEGLKVALDAANTFLPQLEKSFSEAGTVIGLAMTQAVNGNMAMFAQIGAIIGEAMWIGVKSVFTRGMNSLLSKGGNFVGGRWDKTMDMLGPLDQLPIFQKVRQGVDILQSPDMAPSLADELMSNIEQSGITKSIDEIRKQTQILIDTKKSQEQAVRLLMDMQNVITPRFAN